MSDEILKRFGRYFLLDRLAQGGMAEIFRARLADANGAGRILVIKRIQANFRSNAEFLQMFKSEIDLTMGFNHPNIVQLYDYGNASGSPYIAMEYVDGRTVRQFAARFFKKKQSMPFDLALYVIEQSARGLSYAHTFKNKISGEELQIVHRDISPQNIIISYDGVVKIIDFGIAKAKTSAELTRTGIIKGKPSYMAPEQVSGQPLDGRADLFALGVVLWELLTGKKLFSTTNRSEYSVLKMIEKCEKHIKPPSAVNPEVPPELDAIVMKALRRKKEDRYSSVSDFQKALQKYLITHFPDFNLGELPYWLDRLFTEEKVEDQKLIRELNKKAEKLIASEKPAEKDPGTINVPVISEIFDNQEAPPQQRSDAMAKLLEKGIPAVSPNDVLGKLGGKSPAQGLFKDQVVLENQPFSTRGVQPSRAQKGFTPHLKAFRRSEAFRFLARKGGMLSVLTGLLFLLLFPETLLLIPGFKSGYVLVQTRYRLIATGQEYIPLLTEILKDTDGQPRGRKVASDSRSMPPETAVPLPRNSFFLLLHLTPAGSGTEVFINNEQVQHNGVIELPLDTPFTIEMGRPKFKSVKQKLSISSSDLKSTGEYQLNVLLEPEYFGYMSVKGSLDAEVHVRELDASTRTIPKNSSTWYFNGRFEMQKFPPGYYLVQLSNRALEVDAVKVVKVDRNRVARVDVELASAVDPGSLENPPDRIMGLMSWFRSAAILGARQGDPIQTWNDSSRNLIQLNQGLPMRRPTFFGDAIAGQSAVRFEGQNSIESSTLASSMRDLKSLTFITVARPQSAPLQTFLDCVASDRTTAGFRVDFERNGIVVRDDKRSYGNPGASPTAPAGVFNIYSVVYSQGSIMIFENGALRLNESVGEVDFSRITHCTIGQGWRFADPSDFFTGDISELMFFDHALSARDQQSIERYLSRLYQIALKR
jgi:serine/threonine protein kinase